MSELENAPIIKLLLVEDHILTRVGLKTILARTPDLQVVGEAENGQESLKMVDELEPNVVLMDVGMPIMDGIEASRRIKEKHEEVKIIMLTSHDNERDIVASLGAGAAGYCLKDVEPERLYSAIRSVNAGDVWLDSHIANKVLKFYLQHQIIPYSSTTSNPDLSTDSSFFSQPAQVLSAAGQSTHTPHPLAEPLSPRELEVLALLVEGLSNQEIADRLIVSLATAKTHVHNIFSKLSVDDRTQAAVQAMRRGLV